jgi:hypothetical protein
MVLTANTRAHPLAGQILLTRKTYMDKKMLVQLKQRHVDVLRHAAGY